MQCIKIAIASGLAWWLGPLLGLPMPFNAVLAVIILMQGHAYGSLLNALQFVLGVAAGLLLGIAAHSVLGISPLVLTAIVLVGLLMGGWLKVSRLGFNNQIAITALLVLATGSADNISRLWETVLGGGIGVLVAGLLWPPNPVGQLRRLYRELRAHLVSDVTRSLDLAGRSQDAGDAEANRRRVREHSERADEAVAAIGPAEEALRWNPWHAGRLQDLSELEDRLRLISHLYRTARALARQVAESPPSDDAGEATWSAARPDLLAAGSRLVRAVDLRLAGQDASELLEQARADVGRFAAQAPREHHAVALAAVVDDLLTDVETWRPSKLVDPERLLVTRIVRRLGWRPASRQLAVDGRLEFDEELRQARRGDLTGVLTGRPRTPPVLTDVVEAAGAGGQIDRGVRDIPLEQVRGSETPTVDFDASFLPRSRRVRSQWVELYTEMEQGRPIQPIDVYQVGSVYFVKHGHKRVSVARRLGWRRIPARVTEVETRAPVGSHVTAQDLLRAGEYATFLEQTELDRMRPEARLACSQLGRYDVIYDHILGHRYFLGMERGHEVSVPEASASWFDTVYLPLMSVARAHDLQARPPGWTDADIYLALSRLWLDLDEEGLPAGPEVAAEHLLADPTAAPPFDQPASRSLIARRLGLWASPLSRLTRKGRSVRTSLRAHLASNL